MRPAPGSGRDEGELGSGQAQDEATAFPSRAPGGRESRACRLSRPEGIPSKSAPFTEPRCRELAGVGGREKPESLAQAQKGGPRKCVCPGQGAAGAHLQPGALEGTKPAGRRRWAFSHSRECSQFPGRRAGGKWQGELAA